MKIKKVTSLLLLSGTLIIAASFVKRWSNPMEELVIRLEKWSTEQPFEKVYLQLDKPFYNAGEDVWFKAYLTIGNEHRPSALSGALNVEIIDENNIVKQFIKVPVSNGIGAGDFSLADSLRQGNYRIRAYTNWMRNAGEEYFFEQNLPIGNVDNDNVFATANYNYSQTNNGQNVEADIYFTDIDNAPIAGKEVNYNIKIGDKQVFKGKGTTNKNGNLTLNFINPSQQALSTGSIAAQIKLAEKTTVNKTIKFTTTSNLADVQFFPESGYMVNGIRSRVAFKAIGADGLGIELKGLVTDNDNKTVAQIATRHLGMGSFALTPQAGKTYKASLTFPDGSVKTINLPTAHSDGYVMLVNSADADNLLVKVSASEGLSNKETYIIGQAGGVVYYSARCDAGSAAFAAKVPKNKFPSGIVQFTLFSTEGKPLNERIAFVLNPSDVLKLNISADNTTSGPRQKVKITLNARSSLGVPVMGSFSAAVINESKVQADEKTENSILSELLLTSDIKGHIEQPNYYFINRSEKTEADLDVLMLTQGYRRFEWKNVLDQPAPAANFNVEKSLKITGSVKNPFGKAVSGGKVTLFTIGKNTFMRDTVTDARGRFVFDNLLFTDTIKFVVQARNAKDGKNVEISVDQPAATSVTTKNLPSSKTSSAVLVSYLQNSKKLFDEEIKAGLRKKNIMLSEVTVTQKKKNQASEFSANLNGAGRADQIVGSEMLSQMHCMSLADCLQGYLTGVTFAAGLPYLTQGMSYSGHGGPMLIVIDGMYAERAYSNLLPGDIASIEILKRPITTAIYGSRGANGVFIITTKRGRDDIQKNTSADAPGIKTYSIKGFYAARQFYVPRYDATQTNTAVADLRTTIHWEPFLVTDRRGGNATFEFFNATKGTYRILVQGLDSRGNLGYQTFRYTVE